MEFIDDSFNRLEKDDVWTIVKKFFQDNSIIAQLNSYNYTIEHVIPKMIRDNGTVIINGPKNEDGTQEQYKVIYDNVYIKKPTFTELNGVQRDNITPIECINRNITYEAEIYVDVCEMDNQNTIIKKYKKYIGSIPVPVKSRLCHLYDIRNDENELYKLGECPYDKGGYFIMKGSLKMISEQERGCFNKIQRFKTRKSVPKYEWYAEIRSTVSTGAHTVLGVLGMLNVRGKYMSSVLLTHIPEPIPIGIMFKAFGYSHTEVCDMLVYQLREVSDSALYKIKEFLEYNFELSYNYTQDDALEFIGKKGRKYDITINDDDEEIDTQLEPDDEIESEPNPEEDNKKMKNRDKKIKDRDNAISYASYLLEHQFLTHVTSDSKVKAFYLSYILYYLVCCIFLNYSLDIRDLYCNKRVNTLGALMSGQFNIGFRKMIKDSKLICEKALMKGAALNIQGSIKYTTITNCFKNALMNNTWNNRVGKIGISQTFEQFNYTATLANARKFATPMSEGNGKIVAARTPNGSHFGGVCISETPEGKKTGLIKNQALMCLVTCGEEPDALHELIIKMDYVKNIQSHDFTVHDLNTTKILLNGNWIGNTHKPDLFVNMIRKLRRSLDIHVETAITYDLLYDEIRINIEPGRLCRPLLIVENGELLMNTVHIQKIKDGYMGWTDILSEGLVEFIDKDEEDNTIICGSPQELDEMGITERIKITHCEIHPSMMYAIGGSIIPYPDHNQAPRITYQSSMGKQSIGIPFLNYKNRMKGKVHLLGYPQKPLVSSRSAEILGCNDMPAGFNAIVAICPYEGFNQEDSVVWNQFSIDRGLGVSYTQVGYGTTLKTHNNERFEIPNKETCNNFKGNPNKLDDDAIVSPGTRVEYGDILIGKVCVLQDDEMETNIHRKNLNNISILYTETVPGVVFQVQKTNDGEGYPSVNITIMQKRTILTGDKVASRHAQKGTTSMIFRQEDMPFTSQGISPDILLNPLCMPSRMTIGHLIETLAGKAIATSSPLKKIKVSDYFENNDNLRDTLKKISDGTPFHDFSLERIQQELKSMGFDMNGDEMMFDGKTGKAMKNLIFIGPIYYQRLKHIAIEKINIRARGQRTGLTRQPECHNSSASGNGLRIGVMERANILAQGCSAFIMDRLKDNSDKYKMWICDICGLPAIVDKSGTQKECRVCETNKVSLIELTYGAKLLMQELAGMGIWTRIIVDKFGNTKVQPIQNR